MRTNNIHARQKKTLRATRPVTEKKKTERPRFAVFFLDEIFGAFEFEFFASQVSPAKSKKGAALIVQTLETITWPMKKKSWLGYLRNQKLPSYMGIIS